MASIVSKHRKSACARAAGLMAITALALGCAVSPTSDDEDLAAEKAKGVPEEGFPSVCKLYVEDGACTCTRIAPRAVLTAAHCVWDAEKKNPKPPNSIVWASKSGSGPPHRLPGNIAVHPGYKCAYDTGWLPGAAEKTLDRLNRYDLAVVYYDWPYDDYGTVAQINYRPEKIAPRSCSLNLVGNGIGGRGNVPVCVDGISQQFIEGHHPTGWGTSCEGDSGAGLFTSTERGEVLVGVFGGGLVGNLDDPNKPTRIGKASKCGVDVAASAAAFNQKWLECAVNEGSKKQPDAAACDDVPKGACS